ncbi:MAG: MFS transporter [Pseudomonadota bacterium]
MHRSAWPVAGFACLALMVSNGMTVSGLSVYDIAFIEHFAWSLGEIKFRDLITLMLTGLLAPFAGVLLDRYGVRRCMLIGWCVLALAYLAYWRLQTLLTMYAIHAAFAVVLVFCGLNAAVILVSNWFTRYRGTAIGIALVGTSLGGALFPQYGTAMIAAVGWQGAFFYATAFPLLLFIITALLVRDRPAGAVEGGASDEVACAPPSAGPDAISYGDAVRSTTFWALALIAMATFYTVLGVQAHVYKYMRDAGFDAQIATNAVSLFFLAALAGKFLFGLLADFIDGRKVFVANLLVMLLGCLILLQMNVDQIWIAMATFGLGWGGVYTLLQFTVMNTFGTRDAGKILGTITILDACGGGLGIWLTGIIYDATGDYRLPFSIFTALVVFALACLTQVKTPQRRAPVSVGKEESSING